MRLHLKEKEGGNVYLALMEQSISDSILIIRCVCLILIEALVY